MDNIQVCLRCEDGAEAVVFTRYEWTKGTDYEINVEDSYCGGEFRGTIGRFRRAWRAFWSRPVRYTGVYCEGSARIKKFLEDCLNIVNEDIKNETEV